MDLVYQLSEHPVALLARPLQIESELDLLAHILLGNLVNGESDYRLSRGTTFDEARKALWLLGEITRDIWWGRAWTFQENYRGGSRMRLLIRHHQSLEQQKLRHQIFGEIPGELCVPSVTFSEEATRLCLALRSSGVKLPADDDCRINDVLRAAGRYKMLLRESSTMTPTIVTDIEKRKLLKPWDRLAILANCCQYPVRLDCEALSEQGRSLSLSVLAMCLLNGEILDNNDGNLDSAAPLKTSEFLKRQLFGAFIAPKEETKRLTYNKGCRLTDVELTTDGILTKGHLWKLGRVINTSMFRKKLPRINPNGRLFRDERRRLLQLGFCLNNLEHYPLADLIEEYLDTDATFDVKQDFASFTEMYLHHMAVELAAAIEAGRKLRLGSIWDPAGQSVPYSAIFVWSEKDGDEEDEAPAFVFTSAWFRDPGSETYEANDIDRHVSLEVDLEEPLAGVGVPHLRVRRWLLGMCFFDGCPRTQVVFPWPRALQAIRP